MAQTYLRTLSASTFEGIARKLNYGNWQACCDATAKFIVATLHDVHPDKVDVVEWQVGDEGAAIAYRVGN